MKIRVLIATCLLMAVAVSLSSSGVARAQDEKPKDDAKKDEKFVQLVSTDENLFATECWGKWKTDKDLTKYVAHELPKDEFGTVEFKKDERAGKRIVRHLEKLAAQLKERGKPADLEFVKGLKAVYATGSMKLTRGGKSMDAAFALINMFGEPLVILLEGLAPNTDWETARMSLIRDPDGDHDLLFVGGDHKDESYIAMKRDGVK